jgi:hypothetical protein
VLHPPATPPAGGGGAAAGWGCELGSPPKCIGVGGYEAGKPNLHPASNCSGLCPSLGPMEWLALAEFWHEASYHAHGGGPSVVVATQSTFLKKSVEQSNSLPPSEIKAVPKGFRCTLEAGGMKYQGYWLCSVAADTTAADVHHKQLHI